MSTISLWSRWLVTLGAATMVSVSAMAATPIEAARMQTKTAYEHAGFASNAKDAATVHLHLHHVINCLVGANGPGFDAAAGDPCHGQGRGALNDLKAAGSLDKREQHAMRLLEEVHRLAQADIGVMSYGPARDVARAVHGLLGEAAKTLQAEKTAPMAH